MLERMKELLKRKDLCVMATESEGLPHCSLMSYAVSDDGREVWMLTLMGTRKYRNLLANPNVSLLVDTREDARMPGRPRPVALTINGCFRSPDSPEREAGIRRRLVERHPVLEDLAKNPEARVLVVRIRSFQLLDGIAEAHFLEID
ncbi:MAG: pyridoxamine 5'-phosphate oxidase family protein [Syntrophaceae bacterium]|nr:pyridoxamine 5'-phosphate oxidase family protein [Syntrophaceae bacterium]